MGRPTTGALDFLPAVKDWMAEAATRPGISGRRDGARLKEGGLWPMAPLVRRGLGQRELAAAAAHRPPQAAGRRHCVRHAHRSGPAPAGPHSGCGTWDRSAQPPAPSGRQRCATGPGQRTHNDETALATALGHRSHPGEGPKGGVISAADRPGSLGEQGREGDRANPGQRTQNGYVAGSTILSTRLGLAQGRQELLEFACPPDVRIPGEVGQRFRNEVGH